jgi:hypothetical protein
MPKSTEQAPRRARIVLDGLPQGGERPRLAVHALDDTGQVIRSVPVEDDGSFTVDEALLSERAARIIIGPADAKSDERRKFFSLPDTQFREMIRIDPVLAIAGQIWQQWHLLRRCVGGRVRRCFPFLHAIDDILVTRNLAILPEVRKLVDFRPLTRYPFLRCSPICFGTVEVYRRICCCHPPIPPIWT